MQLNNYNKNKTKNCHRRATDANLHCVLWRKLRRWAPLNSLHLTVTKLVQWQYDLFFKRTRNDHFQYEIWPFTLNRVLIIEVEGRYREGGKMSCEHQNWSMRTKLPETASNIRKFKNLQSEKKQTASFDAFINRTCVCRMCDQPMLSCHQYGNSISIFFALNVRLQ